MSDIDRLLKVLETSVEMEQTAREFYLKAAKKSANEIGRRVFDSLADDETRHIVAIRKYCEEITKNSKSPKLCEAMPRHKSINERVIFGKRESELLKTVSTGTDEFEAYEVAMNMENEGYRFYKKAMDEAADPDIKELYKFLTIEEEAHYELISSTYEYLKDPGSWFAKNEKPIVEG